jgi:hypothetical protein
MIQKGLNIAIYLTIFISSYIFFKQPFEGYITYIVLVLLFPVFLGKFGIPRLPLVIFAPLLISGLIYVKTGENTSEQFIKIFVGFFASTLFYNYVMQLYEFDVKKMFKLYMMGAWVVSLIGIIQIVSYQVGFSPGYDFNWFLNKWSYTQGGIGIRMNSVFSEPSYFAAVCAPAFFIATYSLVSRKVHFIKRYQLIIIFFAYFLTFSTLGIIGIFVTILLLLFNMGFARYAIVVGPLFYFGFNWAYDNIGEFRDRFEGTREVFVEQNIQSYNVHGSSFVLYNNYIVASENFKRNPLFGTGLGSHPTAFDKYSLTKLDRVVKIEFNKLDANSMFLRLMSETGLYGMLFIIVFLAKCWVFRQKAANREMWLISNATALIIVLYLARQGHYFLNGFPFFLWLFYYTFKMNRQLKGSDVKEPVPVTEIQPAIHL